MDFGRIADRDHRTLVGVVWPTDQRRRGRGDSHECETNGRVAAEITKGWRQRMNVVAWARVSSREQREGYSIDAQIRAMRDKAAKAGWTIIREFAVAESAKRGADRIAFNQMFKWVKSNAKREKINAIFAHKLDRVCRNMRDAVRLQELEDTCGVQLTFV